MDAPSPGLEVLVPRDVPLGGPRAMPVLRSLPTKSRRTIGAWCFADTFGPENLALTGTMHVPPHPHTGLQTVSWVVEGAIEHRDSIGNKHTVTPGGVHVMTAGSGIAHSEYSTQETCVLHGVQLWIALPHDRRDMTPSFTAIEDVSGFAIGDAIMRVFVGDESSESPTYSPIIGAELHFAHGGSATLPVQAGWEYGVLALTDGIEVGGERVPIGGIVVAPPQSTALTVEARDAGRAILLGGEPLTEPFVMFWNFIGSDHDDVAIARANWMTERDSSDRPRFGTVIDDANTPLPAPRVPGVVLLPAGQAKRP